jgi:integrase
VARSSRAPLAAIGETATMPAAEATRVVRRILAAWEAESPTQSAHTLRAKRVDLEAFGRHLELPGTGARLREAAAARLLLGGFTSAQEDVRGWLVAQAARGAAKRPLSPRTRARRLAHLRGLVRVAQEYGLPWGLHLRGPRLGRPRGAEGPEAWHVYASIASLIARSKADPRAARDAAILQLLFVLGLRRQSVVDLSLADYRGATIVLRVKGDEEPRTKSVPRSTQRAIAAWLEHRGDAAGPLFVGVRRGEEARGLSGGQIWWLCRRHGVGHPHGLRHSGATRLAREGHTVFDLQSHLGHASPMSSQPYVDRVEDVSGKASSYLAEEFDALYDRA